MGILLVIAVFLVFLAALGVRSGRATGRRIVLPLPSLTRVLKSLRPEPVLIAQVLGGVLVLGAMLAYAGDIRPLGAALLGVGGGCLVYAGVAVAENKNGEADRLAERHWESQNIFLKDPQTQARNTAAGQAILGGLLVLVALLTLAA
jgi:hypothetical protein